MKKKSLSEAWLSAGVGNCLRPPVVVEPESKSDFLNYIKEVAAEVETWPAWKKNQLGAEYVTRTISEDIPVLPEDEEPEFDSPHGSVWIVAVDYAGRVSVLQTPNIHPGILDNGPEAEYLGLPPDVVDDMGPGVYRWTCNYVTHTDWESGHVDGWDFEVEESVLLWSPDNA